MAKTRLEKIVTKHLGYVAAGYENEVADGHRKIEELPDATELRYDVFEDIKASEGLDVRREDRLRYEQFEHQSSNEEMKLKKWSKHAFVKLSASIYDWPQQDTSKRLRTVIYLLINCPIRFAFPSLLTPRYLSPTTNWLNNCLSVFLMLN